MAGKVVVTGATGFIGVALVARLEERGYEVIGLGSRDGDIATVDLRARLQNFKPERLIHLAGQTFVPDSWQDPLNFYRVNVQGTANVADYCRKTGAALTYVSAYVYGTPAILPIREDSAVNPNNPYGQSKFLGELVCQQFSASFALPTTILRPFNIYGRGQSSSFLIPKIIHQVLNSDVIELDNLQPRRDYIYIDDLVDAIIVSLSGKEAGTVHNLGSGLSVSVEEIVRVVQARAGTNKPVISRNIQRENEVMDVVADISKFSSTFSWRPKFGFADGIDAIFSTLPRSR